MTANLYTQSSSHQQVCIAAVIESVIACLSIPYIIYSLELYYLYYYILVFVPFSLLRSRISDKFGSIIALRMIRARKFTDRFVRKYKKNRYADDQQYAPPNNGAHIIFMSTFIIGLFLLVIIDILKFSLIRIWIVIYCLYRFPMRTIFSAPLTFRNIIFCENPFRRPSIVAGLEKYPDIDHSLAQISWSFDIERDYGRTAIKIEKIAQPIRACILWIYLSLFRISIKSTFIVWYILLIPLYELQNKYKTSVGFNIIRYSISSKVGILASIISLISISVHVLIINQISFLRSLSLYEILALKNIPLSIYSWQISAAVAGAINLHIFLVIDKKLITLKEGDRADYLYVRRYVLSMMFFKKLAMLWTIINLSYILVILGIKMNGISIRWIWFAWE